MKSADPKRRDRNALRRGHLTVEERAAIAAAEVPAIPEVEIIHLSREASEQLVNLLLNPPEPNEALREDCRCFEFSGRSRLVWWCG